MDDLEIIGSYADVVDEAGHLVDKGSLRTAQAAERVYLAKAWVEEWNQLHPIKINATGRPADPEGRNRYSQWLAWKLREKGFHPIRGTRTYQLLDAAATMSSFHARGRTHLDSEWTIRPLVWLMKNHQADKVAEVWAHAVELAGSEKAVTNEHTTKAMAAYKKALGTKGVKQVVRKAKAERDRQKAILAIQTLWGDGDDGEVKTFDAWYRDFRRGKDRADLKVVAS